MAIPTTDLTCKILSFADLQIFDSNDCIDWANEMLLLGYDTFNLCILAGIEKPTNYYEVSSYFKNSVAELGLKFKSGDDATLAYAGYYIKKLANGESLRENLSSVYTFCQSRDYEGLISDFYLLHWAWEDLEYDDTYVNHYWEGITKQNIESTIINVAKNWIEKNQKALCPTPC